jgi:hypothetical protein
VHRLPIRLQACAARFRYDLIFGVDLGAGIEPMTSSVSNAAFRNLRESTVAPELLGTGPPFSDSRTCRYDSYPSSMLASSKTEVTARSRISNPGKSNKPTVFMGCPKMRRSVIYAKDSLVLFMVQGFLRGG